MNRFTRSIVIGAAVAGAALALTACGSASASESNRCEPISASRAAASVHPNAGNTIAWETAKAVKSKDYKGVWFVAANIHDASGDVTGIWAMLGDPTLETSGGPFAVNLAANNRTDSPVSHGTFDPSIWDEGVSVALGCI